MTHFGIICPAAAGHLNPMTTLGYELKRRGHRVTVIGIEDARAKTLAAELEFQAIGKSDFPVRATKDLFIQLGNLSGFKAFQYTLNWITKNAEIVLRDAPEIITTEKIEALLVDQAAPEGGTVAEHLDIPFVSVCSAIMLNREINVPPFITAWNYDPTWGGLLRNKLGYILLNRIGRPLRKVINDYRQQWHLSCCAFKLH
jgi:zeaxanthin glucosyltransferase